MKAQAQRKALKITMAYLIMGVLWITLGHHLNHLYFADNWEMIDRVEMWKGLLYVLLTAGVLHSLYVAQLQKTLNQKEQKEQALAKADRMNELYQRAFEATLDVLWDLEFKTGIIHFGDNFNSTFDYRDEAIPQNVKEANALVHPDDRERVTRSFEETLHSGESTWQNEFRQKSGSGGWAYVEVHGVIVKNKGGEPERLIGTVRNITHRKKRQQEMQLMESALENISDSVLITDTQVEAPGPNIIYANSAFYEHSGYRPQEVIGKSPRFLQGYDTQREHLKGIRKAMEQGVGIRTELINYHKSGRPFWIDFVMTPLRNNEGQLTHFVSIQRDITPQKEQTQHEEFISQLFVSINKSSSLEDRVQSLIQQVGAHCKADYGELWLLNLDADFYRRTAAIEIHPGSLPGYALMQQVDLQRTNDGFIGAVAQNKGVLTWEAIADNPRFLRRKEAKQLQLKAAVGIPFFQQGSIIGALALYSRSASFASDADQGLLQKLSAEMGGELMRIKVEDELQNFIKLSPDILCIMDERGCFKKISPALERLTGLDQAALLEQSLFGLAHPEDQNDTRDFYSMVLNGGPGHTIRHRLLDQKGKVHWVSWSAQYAENLGLVYAVGKDVSAHQRKSDQLKSLRLLQNSVINNTRDLIWAFDGENRLLLANEAYFTELKDLSGKEIKLGQKLASQDDTFPIFNLNEKTNWQKHYREALNGQRQDFTITQSGLRDTRKYQVEINPIYQKEPTNQSTVVGAVCYAHDITQRLRYIDRIEGQNARLREIAWTQSHLVRAPLSRILALADVMKQEDFDQQELPMYLQYLVSSTEELDEVIRQIIQKATEARQNV